MTVKPSVWVVIAISFGLVIWFYWAVGHVVMEMSDHYAVIHAQRKSSASYSGLHDSYLTPLLGRKIDLKDAQFHTVRDALPLLSLAAVVFLTSSYCVKHFATSTNRLKRLVLFYASTGVAFVFAVFERDAVFVLGFILLNFYGMQLVEQLNLSSRLFVPLSWMWVIIQLFIVNKKGGIGYQQGMMNFETSFNFVILRLQSYNLDKHSARSNISKPSALKKDTEDGYQTAVTGDGKTPLPRKVYTSLLYYIAYVLYIPLYICGPVITFEDFFYCMTSENYSASPKRDNKLVYFCRFLLCLGCIELFQHYFYVSAITYMSFRQQVKHGSLMLPLLHVLALEPNDLSGEELSLSAEKLMLYSYLSLLFLWFKFLLIWRFFRCWAVFDDIYPVENMQRCVNNNYTVVGFWKGWHGSLNRYLVKYMYIPLGGNKVSLLRKLANVFIVFLFVAIWHDLEWHLMLWGLFFAAVFIPEMLVISFYKKHLSEMAFFKRYPTIELLLCASGGGVMILAITIGNIIGYTIGLDAFTLLSLPGQKDNDSEVDKLVVDRSRALRLLCWYYLCMCGAAVIMILIERRRAVLLKKKQQV